MSLIVKIILLELASSLSAPVADKIQWLVPLSFNSVLQLNNGISSDLQKLLRYFNSTAIVVFLKILFSPSVSVLPNNLAFYMKDLKLLELSIKNHQN